VERLRDREQANIQLWASAQAELPKAQLLALEHQAELDTLSAHLNRLRSSLETPTPATEALLRQLEQVINQARGMSLSGELSFITENILVPNFLDIPAIVVDARQNQPAVWRNIPSVPDTISLQPEDAERLMALALEMAEDYPPIPIELDYGDDSLEQQVYYAESDLVSELRLFPYVQLLFVSLFILVGYLGFSYVRRSEQSSLWVGMAKEAAHQLGTPISSLMGWIELMRMAALSEEQEEEAIDEVEKDVQRLQRVANRFSDIGSLPKLEVLPLAPVIAATADYVRRRIPQYGKRVTLGVSVPDGIHVQLNAELFEWVVENLLKNALDAIETESGAIDVQARQEEGRVYIEVQDTGKGIDRRHWKNVFRPGYSTKKRGWGLGLSLAKRIVEDYHGGTLAVARSRPGEGTTFRIELPALSNGQ
jgi:signal transduction histidine kinase